MITLAETVIASRDKEANLDQIQPFIDHFTDRIKRLIENEPFKPMYVVEVSSFDKWFDGRIPSDSTVKLFCSNINAKGTIEPGLAFEYIASVKNRTHQGICFNEKASIKVTYIYGG